MFSSASNFKKHLVFKLSLVSLQLCMFKVDIHVRDGQDSHENADFIVLNARGGNAVIHIGLSSVLDFLPGKHSSSHLPAG